MTELAVLGAGSWGTALTIALASRFAAVRLWTRDPTQAHAMHEERENRRYLPGFPLPSNVSVRCEAASAVAEADVVLAVVPSCHARAVLETFRPHIPRAAKLVSAIKGLEQDSLSRMSEVIHDVLGDAFQQAVAVLSGPTFAREVAAGEPAAMVIGAEQIELAEEIQHAFATTTLRFYTSTDVVGIEIGAALKNVIAIGAGVCSGLGLGSNSVAALVTRGLAEITRLAAGMGGQPRTLSGLAGLGDLVLTATGDLSRNRFVGMQLGQGRELAQIMAEMTMVAEGVGTCRAAYQLGKALEVDLPIVNKMYEVLYEAKEPKQAIRELMERPLTSE